MRTWALVGMLSVALAAQVSGRRLEPLILPSRGLSGPLRAEIHLPAGYVAHPGRRYPVCLLLHGGGGSASELRELGLADLATRHGVIIVAPDAGEALFEDAEAGAGPRLASALVETLLPAVDRRYRTLGSRQGRLLVGLSLGGYSALHLGITHPEAFGFIASLSGVVGIAGWTSQDEGFLPARLRTQLHRALGEPGSPGRQARDLATLLDSLPPAAIRGLPFLRMDCGREDWFFEANRCLSRRMTARGIPHAFHAPPGRHDEAFWRRQLEEVLRDWVNAAPSGPTCEPVEGRRGQLRNESSALGREKPKTEWWRASPGCIRLGSPSTRSASSA